MIIPNLTEEMVNTVNETASLNLGLYQYEENWLRQYLIDREYYPENSTLVMDAIQFKMDDCENPHTTDFENAVMLYESLEKSIAPFVAASGGFWTALVHANLPYMRYRWPLGDDEASQIKTLEEHYLMNWNPSRRERSRNGLSRLWWIVYLTVDEKSEDRYALTREVMRYQDVMSGILDRDQFNRFMAMSFAKVLLKERDSGNPLNRKEIRALMKHVSVLDRSIIIYAMDEDSMVSKLEQYLTWYRKTDIHMEEVSRVLVFGS